MMRRKPMEPARALERLTELCDRGEYCSHEILVKLRNWGVGDNDSRKILSALQNQRFVDDARFARSFAHSKAAYSHWGRVKIKMHLINKRIAAPHIAEALEAIDPDLYAEALQQVLAAKKRQLGSEADTYEGRTKLFRHAVMKGYEAQLVAAAIRSHNY